MTKTGGKNMNYSGCVICGEDIEYLNENTELTCSVCQKKFNSNAKCTKGHYVCDNCHKSDAIGYIENYCKNTLENDPIKMSIEIMKNPKIKMHGPEHHFLVPAVLLASYYNTKNMHKVIPEKLIIAKDRSKNVLGGFCGFYGNCGAGVGTGIFISIISDATPLSDKEWKLCNLMTSKSLENIANNGGIRCCKRDSFIALETAIDFLENNMCIKLPKSNIKCIFNEMNKECKKTECKYFLGGNCELS
jgi:hypothetical protein